LENFLERVFEFREPGRCRDRLGVTDDNPTPKKKKSAATCVGTPRAPTAAWKIAALSKVARDEAPGELGAAGRSAIRHGVGRSARRRGVVGDRPRTGTSRSR
jgi:hypothetical protein